MPTIAEKAERFRELHARPGTFIIPNPFDAGSARILQHLGFEALATTSSGYAYSTGRMDYGITRDDAIAHAKILVDATDIPVSADLENGFGDDPDTVAETVRMAAGVGLAGCSIEDSTQRDADPIYSVSASVDRVRAAVAAARAVGRPFTLTARAENYLHGRRDLKDTIARLQAYQDAGADVLYAPGLHQPDDIKTFIAELSPKPLNIIMSRNTGLTVAALADLGVRRISVGSSLARAAWTGFMHAAETIAKEGSFSGFDGLVPYADLNNLFRR